MRQFLLILFGVLVLPAISPAQEYPVQKDNELWTGAKFKLKLSKRWRAEAEQQLRFKDDYKEFKTYFTEVGLRYEVTKYFDLKGQYRYSVKGEDNRNRSRFSLDASLEWDIDNCKLDIGYRMRIQDAKVAYTGQKITYLRNKFILDYNLSKLGDPFAEYESFYRFNDKQEFRVHRYTFGVEWKINKDMDLKTYYRIDQEFNVKIPDRQHIVGLIFSYKMKV